MRAALVALAVVLLAPVVHGQSSEPQEGQGDGQTTDWLKSYIQLRRLSPKGNKADLLKMASDISIVEREMDMGVLTDAGMVTWLNSRNMDITGDPDQRFVRLSTQVMTNLKVLEYLPNLSLTNPGHVRTELTSLGFRSATLDGKGLAALLQMLGQALEDVAVIRHRTFQPILTITREYVVNMLKERGLKGIGPMDGLLSRLARQLSLNTGDPSNAVCTVTAWDSLCINHQAPGQNKTWPPHLQSVQAKPIENRIHVIGARSKQDGLVGWWTFEDAASLDHSGYHHHIAEPAPLSQGRGGVGNAALLNGRHTLLVDHAEVMSVTNEISMSMWVYLAGDANGKWRTLVHKGSQDAERTPTLMLEPNSRGLELFVSTSDAEERTGERVVSASFLQLRQWTHVAFTVEGRNLRLFIDGVLDAEEWTKGNIIYNSGPLHMGNDPWRVDGGVACLLDDVRMYNEALHPHQIAAEVGIFPASVEPSFVSLACVGCSFADCQSACLGEGDHMCATQDMAMGAYYSIRSRGWATSTSHIWIADDPLAPPPVETITEMGHRSRNHQARAPASVGVCVCCHDAAQGDKRLKGMVDPRVSAMIGSNGPPPPPESSTHRS